MTLNVKLRSGSERRTEKCDMMTLNVETEDATLNVDLKIDDGSECRN